MCGFLVAPEGTGNSTYIQRRGPDGVGVFTRNGLTFQHFLLNVTGPPTPQPFVEGDVVAIYNGEIYNRPYVRSDGESIIPAYLAEGVDFPKVLDGEFAIALYDFEADRAIFVTDRFATKPMWRNGSACASYESGVGGHKIRANTIEAVRISSGDTIWSVPYHYWDWRQRDLSYDRCLEALEQAVVKRHRTGCFIGLSSGYDSGAIACVLENKALQFKAYIVPSAENVGILRARSARLDTVEVIKDLDVDRQTRHLTNEAEEFHYAIEYDDGTFRGSYKEDYAAKALSGICERAVGEGRKVYLSGTGADEILSDYALIPRQSHFKGTFPLVLSEWPNFVGSCMYSYLGKEELVGGSWGIESRYPFLDTAFVQSFLSLSAKLKNQHYKAPLYEYLTAHGFPFSPGTKIGWTAT